MLGRRVAQRLKEAGLRRQQALERLDDDAAEFVVMLVDQAGRHRRIVERRDDHLVAHAARECRASSGTACGKLPGRFGARLIRL